MQWYIKKIRHMQPELLHYNEYLLRDWIDDLFFAIDDELASEMDDILTAEEKHYGKPCEEMSRDELLETIAKLAPILERGDCMIELTVPGEAVPQARPRVTRCGTYDPPKCRAYKQKVGLVAKTAMRGKEPLRGPVKMSIIVYRGIPKSWTKKKKAEAMAGTVYPTTKPDIDNILKGLMDALKGIVWRDDAQVISVEASKEYAEHPRVWVHVCKVVERGQDSETKD